MIIINTFNEKITHSRFLAGGESSTFGQGIVKNKECLRSHVCDNLHAISEILYFYSLGV